MPPSPMRRPSLNLVERTAPAWLIVSAALPDPSPTARAYRMLAHVRVAFFTAGTTGAGHLVRGLAIDRAIRREGAGVELALFGPRSKLTQGLARARGVAELR